MTDFKRAGAIVLTGKVFLYGKHKINAVSAIFSRIGINRRFSVVIICVLLFIIKNLIIEKKSIIKIWS